MLNTLFLYQNLERRTDNRVHQLTKPIIQAGRKECDSTLSLKDVHTIDWEMMILTGMVCSIGRMMIGALEYWEKPWNCPSVSSPPCLVPKKHSSVALKEHQRLS
ncbi:hypothetical protein PGT21_000911 [Puccinia graminis f. sp. tritici]|uniref:Uncharacterized protein n=1 Tax=Puccinia graminis f. sp. tritici TaxID=56615 RepID=A0A5B0P1X2_PUCGR|nr:hypothetical protein PGT21_000911 [Puccinia graminis f. sp. tritici]